MLKETKIRQTSLCVQLLSFFLMFSCQNFSSFKNSYIISREDSLQKTKAKRSDGIILLPPEVMYGRYNFILDSNNNFYFFSFQESKESTDVTCGEEPKLISLKPNHLFKIPKGLEKAFFEENVLKQISSENVKAVSLASFKYTIHNEFVQFLIDIKGKNSLWLNIRLALPEEREVIFYKNKGKHYEPQGGRKEYWN